MNSEFGIKVFFACKTVSGTTTEYYWLNGVLQGQKTGSEYILFLYDENGAAYGMLIKNGSTENYYYYIFNLQGDVIGIVNQSGAQVVSYSYGPWGDLLFAAATNGYEALADKNPIRYRGYYYDAETEFYYLQSRYYDPEICRFINADGQIADIGGELLGYNMFAYCMNNPVNAADHTGNWPKWIKNVAKVAVAVVVATVTAAIVVTAGAAAVALGASTAVVSGIMTGAAVGGLVAGSINIGTQCIKKGSNNVNAKEAAKSTFFGATSGAISGGVSGAVPSIATNTATKLLVQKGFQIGANVLISNTAYFLDSSMSNSGPSLYGYVSSTVGGIVSGATFNAPAGQAFVISLGLGIAANGEELINIFGEKSSK